VMEFLTVSSSEERGNGMEKLGRGDTFRHPGPIVAFFVRSATRINRAISLFACAL
jgi:hypothetical protein